MTKKRKPTKARRAESDHRDYLPTAEDYRRAGWTQHGGGDEPAVLVSPDGDSQVALREDGTLYDHHA